MNSTENSGNRENFGENIENTENYSEEYRSDFDSDIQWREDDDESNENYAYTENSSENTENDKSDGQTSDEEEPIKLDELVKSGDRYAEGYKLLGKKPSDGKKSHSGLFSRKGSFIMRLIDKTVSKIYEKTKTGLIGRFFTSYDALESETESSAIVSSPDTLGKALEKKRMSKAKTQVVNDDITGKGVATFLEPSSRKTSYLKKAVNAVEDSFIVTALGKFLSTLLYIPMMTYGVLSLVTGITTIIVQAIKGVWFLESFSITSLIIGVLYALLAIVTVFAKDEPLAKYLCESRFGSFLLVGVFGISKKNIDVTKRMPKYGIWAFLFGIILGLLSATVSAFDIILFLVTVVFALGIANNPESGVVMTLFALPFAQFFAGGEKQLQILIIYVFLTFVIKLLRGQRRIKIGTLGVWTALFVLFILLTAFVSLDRGEAFVHARYLIGALLGFFLVSSLITTKAWTERAHGAFVLSGLFVSLYGIYEWIMLAVKSSWNFERFFINDISSFFSTSEALSIYLVTVFFFALSGTSVQRAKGFRLISFVSLMFITACTVFTTDVLAWTVLVAAVMLSMLIRSKKNAASIFGLFVVIFFIFFFVSDILPIYYIEEMAGSPLSQRIGATGVTLRIIGQYMMTGIGLGETVFANIYSSLSPTGIAFVTDSGNLLLEMTVRFGIMGAVFLVGTIILVYRQAFSHYKVSGVRRYSSLCSVTALSAFTAVLLMSGVGYIWSDFPSAYLFWSLAGLVSSSRRLSRYENTLASGDGELDITLPISSFTKKVKKHKNSENKENREK